MKTRYVEMNAGKDSQGKQESKKIWKNKIQVRRKRKLEIKLGLLIGLSSCLRVL